MAPSIALQTTLLSQLGESYSANRSLMSALQSEELRLGTLQTRVDRAGDVVASSALDVAYNRHRTRWIIRTIMITMLATMLVLVPAALYRMDFVSAAAAYVIAACVLVAYLVTLIILIRNIAFRRRDDWDRYYFRANADVLSQQAQAAAGCPAAVTAAPPSTVPDFTLTSYVIDVASDRLSFSYTEDRGRMKYYMQACAYFTIDAAPQQLTYNMYVAGGWGGNDVIGYGPSAPLTLLAQANHTFDFYMKVDAL